MGKRQRFFVLSSIECWAVRNEQSFFVFATILIERFYNPKISLEKNPKEIQKISFLKS